MSQKYIGNKEKLRRTGQKIAFLKRELKKKDKIINEMISEIYRRTHTKEKSCSFQNNENCSKYNSCTECIYEYFENLIKGEKQC